MPPQFIPKVTIISRNYLFKVHGLIGFLFFYFHLLDLGRVTCGLIDFTLVYL